VHPGQEALHDALGDDLDPAEARNFRGGEEV
jgi:hypothetical protein